ncbi:class I SAM-dependent methyltransferase [Streptomyces rochei]|uniref:Class I SAM-dependent methyltransferase n=2 Tax=Streptomyces rochei group TaxID=2867164 RepID=A0AAX3ZQX4_STRRO|nr:MULTISPECIES: class I SAM-dependent methyltransferase [Streptomyces]MDI3098505.1 class I SAM-dependent methyltransferase [Streptomyces sp. AN-3]UXI81373.1 class I SAM-dependent methyltransferase [Streptomyces vinaceusdrappus]WMC89113.1 class I SAM-dependent methyltransferase [Streptomyces rochei]
MTDATTATGRAAAYWNSPETVAEFRSLDVQPYLTDLLARTPVDGPALDLGCGGGRNTLALLERGFDVLAVDLHQGMVDATRARTAAYPPARITVRQGAADAVPAEDGAFALAVCYGVLHNAVDRTRWEASVGEIARVLRPGGLLALNTFTSQTLDPRLRPGDGDGQYLLPDDVPMTLLPVPHILDAFAARGLRAEGAAHTYVRDLDVGPRAVLRCVLRREGG